MQSLLKAEGLAKVLFLLSNVVTLALVLVMPAEYIAFAVRFITAVGLVLLVQHYYGEQLSKDPLFFLKKPTAIGEADGGESSNPTEGDIEERAEDRSGVQTT